MARRWANYDSYIECKTWGHAWEDYDSASTPRQPFRYREVVRCTRCATVRTRYMDAEGDTIGHPQYKYADGYRDVRGAEKPTRAEMRILIIRRKG